MAMTVTRNAGTKAPETFHEEGVLRVPFRREGYAHEEVTFKIRFGAVGHAEGEGPKAWTVKVSQVRRATGQGCRSSTQAGLSLRARPGGSSRATRVCGSSLAWPWICSLETGQESTRSAPDFCGEIRAGRSRRRERSSEPHHYGDRGGGADAVNR